MQYRSIGGKGISRFTIKLRNISWLSERCILAPLNETTRAINGALVAQLPGEFVEYRSLDSAPDESQAVHFPSEFLNSLEVSGFPSHLLSLKVAAPIIILRSLGNYKTFCKHCRGKDLPQ